jgi:hypothetical protein
MMLIRTPEGEIERFDSIVIAATAETSEHVQVKYGD